MFATKLVVTLIKCCYVHYKVGCYSYKVLLCSLQSWLLLLQSVVMFTTKLVVTYYKVLLYLLQSRLLLITKCYYVHYKVGCYLL